MNVKELIESLVPHEDKVFRHYPEIHNETGIVSIGWWFDTKKTRSVSEFIEELRKWDETYKVEIDIEDGFIYREVRRVVVDKDGKVDLEH